MYEAGLDNILQEDLEWLANRKLPFDKWTGCTFLITGATGLIGSLLVKNLLCCSRVHKLELKIIAVVRNIKKARDIYSEVLERSELSFLQVDFSDPLLKYDENIDYIIHTAAVTTSKIMVTDPVNTIKTSLYGTLAVLDLAVKKKVKGVVYISSMEIYGVLNESNHAISEHELGYVDLMNVRSCYPEGKRMCECMVGSYVNQFGISCCSARLAQVFGAGVLPWENRVFAQFARCVKNGKDIVLHTIGKSEGNYIYTRDAIWAILILMDQGKAGQSYNISNEKSHMSIAKMGNLVANEVAEGRIKVVYDVPVDDKLYGYAPDVKMKLSSSKMQNLGWKADIGLVDAYKRMIASMDTFRER